MCGFSRKPPLFIYKLYNSLDLTNKRTVDSFMEKHAGGVWLKVIPTEPKLFIPSDKMVIGLRLFLGTSLQEDVKECPICRKVGYFNVHMLICSTQKYLMYNVMML